MEYRQEKVIAKGAYDRIAEISGNQTYLKVNQPPVVQMKRLSEFSYDELKMFWPLLWSEEKFISFLEYFADTDVGARPSMRQISELIRQYSTPQIVKKGCTTDNFQSGAIPHTLLGQIPMSTENSLVPVDSLTHFHLGFRSIAVLKRATPSTFIIIRVMQYTNAFSNVDLYSNAERALKQSIDRKDMLAAYRYTELLSPGDASKQSPPVSSVITDSVSSCTFIAMSDRDETYAVVMHLDEPTPPNTAYIKNLLTEAGIPEVRLEHMFISKVAGEAEEKKKREVELNLGMQSFGVPIEHQTILDRGDPADFQAYKHDEIGLDFSSEKLKVFGAQGQDSAPEFLRQTLATLLCQSESYEVFQGMLKASFSTDIQFIITNTIISQETFARLKRSGKKEEIKKELNVEILVPFYEKVYFTMNLGQGNRHS